MIAWVWAFTGAGIGGGAWCLARPGKRSVRAAGPAVSAASAACGVLFGLLAAQGMPILLLLALSWFAVAVVVLAGLDIIVRRLPNGVLLAGYIGTAVGLVAEAVAVGGGGSCLRALATGAGAFVLFGALYVAAAGQLGGGDVKLVGLLGLVLGWFGWGTAVAGLWVGLVLAAAGALRQRVCRAPGANLPLGAYLIAGTLLVIAV